MSTLSSLWREEVAGRRGCCCKLEAMTPKRPWLAFGLALMTTASRADGGEAFPQFAEILEKILHVLQTAGVVVVALAITWAGYRILFQHARWADVATLLIGALFIGTAPSLAVWLLYGTADGHAAPQPGVSTASKVARVLERGDIVRLEIDPRGSPDRGQAGQVSLVISSAAVNRRGRALLVPIVSTSSDVPEQPLAVHLSDGSVPTLALIDFVQTEAWQTREPRVIGRVSARSLAAVTACLRALARGAHVCDARVDVSD